MRKILKIAGTSLLILILFRGFIFRLTIKYNEIGTRPKIEITNKQLIEKIETFATSRLITPEDIVKTASTITNSELAFTTQTVSSNPNELINTNKANCVGYSAMFNSVANFLIKKNELEHTIVTEHKIGQLSFMGINLHQFFNNSFLKDHDFNELKNMKTGKVIFIDPTVSDYLWISSVSKKQN